MAVAAVARGLIRRAVSAEIHNTCHPYRGAPTRCLCKLGERLGTFDVFFSYGELTPGCSTPPRLHASSAAGLGGWVGGVIFSGPRSGNYKNTAVQEMA